MPLPHPASDETSDRDSTRSGRLRSERAARLAAARLYLCIDSRRERGDLADVVAAAVAGGVDIVQLRDKGSPSERDLGPLTPLEQVELLGVIAAACHAGDALVAANDDPALAVAAGVDVLHIGQGDGAPAAARAVVGPDVLLGLSTHAPEQAAAADADPCVDYFCCGPVWATPTKPGRAAVGLDYLRRTAAAKPSTPWFAIGGIDATRTPEVVAAGARRIVVVRAIAGADDPEAAARRLVELVDGDGRHIERR